MRRPTSVLALAAFAASTLFAGCSSDGGGGADVSEAEKPYVDAMAEGMASAEDEELSLTEDQERCISARFVDVIGVERFEQAGIEPADLRTDEEALEFTEIDLSEDEGNRLYDSFGACDVDLRQVMLDAMAADEEITPEMQACMEGAFTEENLRKLMVTSMVKGEDAAEDDPALAGFMGTIMGCAFMGMDEGLGEDGGTGGN